MHMIFRAIFAASLLPALAVSPASAQAPQPQQPAKIIGDWGVHCAAAASPAPCEMQQTATQSKTHRRVSSVSIALVPKQNRYILQIAVPLGVALSKGMKIIATGYNGKAMAYRRCDSAGCYVEGLSDAKTIDALGGATGAAKIEVASMNGRTVDLPFSLRGFADARKEMEDRAREKAGSAPAAPPATPAATAPQTDTTEDTAPQP